MELIQQFRERKEKRTRTVLNSCFWKGNVADIKTNDFPKFIKADLI